MFLLKRDLCLCLAVAERRHSFPATRADSASMSTVFHEECRCAEKDKGSTDMVLPLCVGHDATARGPALRAFCVDIYAPTTRNAPYQYSPEPRLGARRT